MNFKKYRNWTIDDEEIKAALAGVIRSGIGSYYRIIDGKCTTFSAKTALMALPMNGVSASKILAEYPMPVIPFKHNKKATVLTEEVLAERREKKAQRAVTAEAKAKKESDAMKAIQAIEEVLEESPSEEQELQVNNPEVKCGRSKKRDPDEELVENGHHCLIQRGDWFGIFHTRNATVHLISKDREAAVSALARYGKVKECHRWN